MKNVLITGSARGIGAQTAKLFAAEGCNVIVNYNTSEKEAAETCREIRRCTNQAVHRHHG